MNWLDFQSQKKIVFGRKNLKKWFNLLMDRN